MSGDQLELETPEVSVRWREGFRRHEAIRGLLERHAGLLQTGSRWTNRMNEWAEKIDSNLAKKDKFLAELAERVRKLEEGRK